MSKPKMANRGGPGARATAHSPYKGESSGAGPRLKPFAHSAASARGKTREDLAKAFRIAEFYSEVGVVL